MAKRRLLLIVFALLSLSLCGCAQGQSESGGAYYRFTDDLGNQVSLLSQPQRVVAVMGSYGELWTLAGGSVVGITDDAVTERDFLLDGSITMIGGVKAPNLEVILGLSPDFVLLSADIDSHVKFDETLSSAGIPHAYFRTDTFDQYLNMLRICTEINHAPERYEKYGLDIQAQIEATLSKAAAYDQSPKVLLIRSMSTNAKALKENHMVGAMLRDLHTENIASRYPSLLDDLSMETIITEDPDFIFIITMGDPEKAMDTLRGTMMANPAWQNLSAVRNEKVFVLPKNLFQYKPNARWGESYEYLEKILYENDAP